MNKYVVDSYEDLLKLAPKYKSDVKELSKYQTQVEAIRNIEKDWAVTFIVMLDIIIKKVD